MVAYQMEEALAGLNKNSLSNPGQSLHTSGARNTPQKTHLVFSFVARVSALLNWKFKPCSAEVKGNGCEAMGVKAFPNALIKTAGNVPNLSDGP